METIDIALASDHAYAVGLLVTAVSLAQRASREVQLRFDILDGGLTDEDWALLRLRLAEAHPQVELRKLTVDEQVFSKFPSWSCGSRMAYARLLVAELVTDADFVVYCDVDFLWSADVAELWKLRDPSVVFQAARDGWARTIRLERMWFERHGLVFDPAHYVCSGLLLVNLVRYRNLGMTAQLMDFLEAHPDVPFVDQTAINAWPKEIRVLPERWGRFSRERGAGRALREGCVLHFAGDTPWTKGYGALMLSDAWLAWFRCYARLTGQGTWKTLRKFFPVHEIVLRRLIFLWTGVPVLRQELFACLRVIGRGGEVEIMNELRT